MKEIFYDYFQTLLHPFRVHQALRASVRLNESDEIGLSFSETVAVSWVFVLINAFYGLFSIHIGMFAYDFISSEETISNILLPSFTAQTQKILLITILIEVVFFPFTAWFYTKFWEVLIRFFSILFEFEGDVEKTSRTVASHALVSNAFLVIPIFGSVCRAFSGVLYIFAGLRKNMEFTTLQSIIVISSPLFLLILLVLMVLVYFTVLFGIL